MKHKVNKKILRRILSLILVMTMLVTGLNLDMMAESVYATQKTETEEKNKKKELTIVKELTDERTENSNTYLMSDGSKQLEIFSEDIRYKKNGKMLEYDSSLIENKDDIIVKKKSFAKADEYAYVNAAGDCKQYIPEKLDDDTPIVLTKGGNVISFMPLYDIVEEKADAKVTEIQNEKVSDKENAKIEQKIVPDVKLTETDSVRYKKENIVYEFVSENNGLKENVIFESKPEKYDVSYEFKIPNLYLEYSKDTNQIYVKSNTNNKIVAYISSPFLNDNTGINLNYDITTNVEQRDEKWIVTYELPKEYFENKKIEYPVVLDPSVWWDSENNIDIRETLNVGGSKSSVIESSSRFMLANLYAGTGTGTDGYGAQVNVRFKNLHNILKGKYISFSYFNMVKESKSGTPKFSIYPIMEDWNYYTTNWNNKPDVSDESICDMNITYDSDTIQPWITNWVRKLSSGEINNDYGIAFYPQENSEYFYLWFYGLSATNTSSGTIRKPVLIVNYKDVEDINAAYDGTFQIEGSYDEENKKIELSWESYNDDIDRYDLYIRKNDNDYFEYAGCTTETNILYDAESGIETYDFRTVAVNEGQIAQYGEYDTQYLSNICSFKKEVDQSDESANRAEVYNLNVKDTDGDGLEDGYEIWDFKTLWNTETGIDEEGNKTYDLDTDDDGFSDSYEVFTLGTNPTVENPETNDSDNDGLSDLEEYAKGTDPWLPNSDFDGVGDSGDSTPRRTNGYTRSHVAYLASVHKGLYDKEYSVTEGDVTVSYITNIYRGEIKQIYYDYGDANLNKKIKYFYDANGNNTAIVEQYDSDYVPNDSNINLTGEDQVICVTYTYDSENNVTFICDQSAKYNMSYDEDGNISSLDVGTYNLIQNVVTATTNYSNADSENTYETIYGNGQKVKKIISEYEVTSENSIAKREEIYFSKKVNGDTNVYGTNVDYLLEYDEEGQIVNFTDYTESVENPVQYQYSYTDSGSSFTRSDGFSKAIEVTESQDENSKITTNITNTTYSFTNLKGDAANINESVVTNDNNSDSTKTLFNGDLYTSTTNKSEDEKDITESKIHSNIFNIDILTSTEIENSNTSRNYRIETYDSEKSIDYVYDKSGNITRITIDESVAYEYTYDPHGRLVTEKDYGDCKFYRYNYGDSANVHSKNIWDLDTNGNKINSTKQTIYLTYDDGDNAQWQDQLKSYNGQSITYDGMGNPLSYLNGLSFAWNRGRQLDKVTFSDNTTASYTYNQNGLRTHKETSTESIEYTWDDSSLIREVVTLKDTNKTYDVWYLYDENNSPVGFMYYHLVSVGSNQYSSLVRYYYEKDLQGNIIGILDAHGYEVVTYSYDAWGNITDTTYTSQIPYQLNHLTYRGYYRDEETGFYYLQSRYYDAEVGRFINADDTSYLGASGTIWGHNLYAYCENNPVNFVDPTGYVVTPANVIGAIVGLVLGAVGGYYLSRFLADKIGLKGWKRTVFVVGISAIISASAATIGYFIGPYVSKAFKSLLNGLRTLFKPRYGTKIGRLGTLTRNTKPAIKGLTQHGIQRMAQRGVSKALAQKIINTGYAVSQGGGKVLYFTKEGVVVLNAAGQVVTAYSSAYFDEAMQAIISLFYK